jgi:hypothetical protein
LLHGQDLLTSVGAVIDEYGGVKECDWLGKADETMREAAAVARHPELNPGLRGEKSQRATV